MRGRRVGRHSADVRTVPPRRLPDAGSSHAKMRPFSKGPPDPAMDIERINQIGTTLADLTERTEALRGYL